MTYVHVYVYAPLPWYMLVNKSHNNAVICVCNHICAVYIACILLRNSGGGEIPVCPPSVSNPGRGKSIQ